MRLIKQQVSLELEDVEGKSKIGTISKHGVLFPDSVRCLICGPSNCGKTNLMINLLYHPNGIKFQNVYIFSKSLYQPKYIQMNEVFSNLSEIRLHLFEDNQVVPFPQDVLPNSVFIFDDIACDKQDRVRSYFCMGRHNGIDSFYLCQSYTRVPKHLIRDNVNFLILFKQDLCNMRRIYEDHVNSDMSFKKFSDICRKCWDDNNFGFIVINKDSSIKNGRYRKGFDTYILF